MSKWLFSLLLVSATFGQPSLGAVPGSSTFSARMMSKAKRPSTKLGSQRAGSTRVKAFRSNASKVLSGIGEGALELASYRRPTLPGGSRDRKFIRKGSETTRDRVAKRSPPRPRFRRGASSINEDSRKKYQAATQDT
jgi:hypothetical protein